ncbi:MAG TPA: O-antigen ligase domain-containing protein [Gammaproteobacteria bacterium]|nr:O-antigen ligase domain-containing protein [Gammaproteobacteria bacterium]
MDKLATLSIWVLIFTIPWQDMLMLPGIGTVSRFVGILVIAISAFATLYVQYARVHLLNLAMFVFWAWGTTTYLWSVDPEGTQIAIVSYFQIMVMMWLIFQWTTRPEDISRFLSAYVLGCYVSVGATLFAYIYNVESAYHRFAAAGFDPNDLAVIMSLGIPMAGYLAVVGRSDRLVWLYRAYPLLALVVVFLTGSRTGFLVAILGCSYMLWTYRDLSLQNKIIFPVSGLIALLLLLPYIPVESLERIHTIGSSVSSGDLNYRTRIWAGAMEALGDASYGGLSILWGVGWDGFPTVITPYLGVPFVSHNAYLSILIEVGLVGFVLFMLIIAMVLRYVLQMPGRERGLWLVLLSMWAIAAMVLNWEFRKETWFLFALAVAHANAVTKGRTATNTVPATFQ